MIVLVVSIAIKEGFKDQFMDSLMGDAIGSNNDETGCYRFDVIQDNENSNLIHLYEVYHDEAAVEAHRAASHYVMANSMRAMV
jgi:autoinducer 2-degrading protein